MNKKSWSMEYMVRKKDEIKDDIQALYLASLEASKKSYSPYSKFPVGAALITNEGSIYSAANQENASFPAGCCAERSLLHYFKSNYPEAIITDFGIIAPNFKEDRPVSPCGVCRQALAEAEKVQEQKISLHLFSLDGDTYSFDSIADLLPLAFEDF